MNVVALAGGVGGSKTGRRPQLVFDARHLTVVVNTGDDFRHFDLLVCPYLDTVCYTLAGLANSNTGWGRANETWSAMETLEMLGAPTWFRLGDRDLGWHLERTRRIAAGQTLSQITADICHILGIDATVLPMSDDPVPTRVYTSEGEMPFQEYFVHHQCPDCNRFRFAGENVNLRRGVEVIRPPSWSLFAHPIHGLARSNLAMQGLHAKSPPGRWSRFRSLPGKPQRPQQNVRRIVSNRRLPLSPGIILEY
jgi:2-phospho-L-lactate transferase